MHNIKNIRFKGYKVFPNDQYAEIENISRVNVVIGKNNCGKTSLLDIFETIYNHKMTIKPGLDVEEITLEIPFDHEMVDSVFSGYSGIGSWNKSSLSKYVDGKLFPVSLKIGNSFEISDKSLESLSHHLNSANRLLASRQKNYRFRKITAERNIFPEAEGDMVLYSDGTGASNLIATFLNDSNYEESVIESEFLSALNRIMQPEAEYVSIRVQQVTYGSQRLWEVFLQEKGFHRVPLSKSGSGLISIKAIIICCLANTQYIVNKCQVAVTAITAEL